MDLVDTQLLQASDLKFSCISAPVPSTTLMSRSRLATFFFTLQMLKYYVKACKDMAGEQ